MKFLEGKTPSERKKIITALVLGLLCVCALSYTFLFSSSSTTTAKKSPTNSNAASANSNSRPASSSSRVENVPSTEEQIDKALLTPIPDNPFPVAAVPEAARNIFAFYEPPPPTPKPIPTEKPLPSPSPMPTPEIIVTYANPPQVFAQTGDFTLEISGDKFTPESKIMFNGMELPTQYAGPQRLTAQVSAQLVSSEGQRQITVRTQDGKLFSNPLVFNVQAPPVPNYSFVGLVARKRFNNDTAVLQHKQTKEYINVRLNDPVPDRFRVVSISGNEVWVVDTALKLRHRLPYVVENLTGGNVNITTRGRRGEFQQNPDTSVQYQEIPGIPNNIPRYVPPSGQMPGQVNPNNTPNQKDDDEIPD